MNYFSSFHSICSHMSSNQLKSLSWRFYSWWSRSDHSDLGRTNNFAVCGQLCDISEALVGPIIGTYRFFSDGPTSLAAFPSPLKFIYNFIMPVLEIEFASPESPKSNKLLKNTKLYSTEDRNRTEIKNTSRQASIPCDRLA